jgi:hypothetical protein
MEDDSKIQAFRVALNQLKSKRFFKKLVEETDSLSISRRIGEAKKMYKDLMDYISNSKRGQANLDADLRVLIDPLGDPTNWPTGVGTMIISILFSDLIEYPLTFNSKLIGQFKKQPNYPTFE